MTISDAVIRSGELVPVPPVTADQLELIRKTIAKDATPDELLLYLHDCRRQGVHPLDKLLHFTKRGGKYAPVTSIDLMRIRAAETGEYCGNDEYTFTGTPGKPGFQATAQVWRVVQGQRVPFARSARWDEYCPPAGADHMWRKMPHVMLGKCAEAQALRAGFPRQLHGLYAAEEIPADRHEGTPSAPAPPVITGPQRKRLFAAATSAGLSADALKKWLLARGIDSTKTIRVDQYDDLIAAIELATGPTEDPPLEPVPPPDLPAHEPGVLRVMEVTSAPTKKPGVRQHFITLSTGEQVTTINDWLASQAAQYGRDRTPIKMTTKDTQYGLDLVTMSPADEPPIEPLPLGDIPF